jgi:hypothetical protein
MSEEPNAGADFVTITHLLKLPCPVKNKETVKANTTKSHAILFATTKNSETGGLPIIITLNAYTKQHFIWTYERRKDNPSLQTSRKTTTEKGKYPKDSFPKNKGGHPEDEVLFKYEVERQLYHDLVDPSEITLRLLWKEMKPYTK